MLFDDVKFDVKSICMSPAYNQLRETAGVLYGSRNWKELHFLPKFIMERQVIEGPLQ